MDIISYVLSVLLGAAIILALAVGVWNSVCYVRILILNLKGEKGNE